VVVLVAHGSKVPDAADAHRAVCRALQHEVPLDVVVEPAFLELTEPDIPTAIDGAVATGAGRVLVLPYFLHPGNHTRHDIPAAVAEARKRHAGAAIELAGVFGAERGLLEVLAGQVDDLLGS
jgi:sirohydrochlorin ferrochelatase